ncbi:MAG: EB domain-containing protein [Myxococcota bacterium]|nr:EB domain-containing protein [Myxococcota bacterium]
MMRRLLSPLVVLASIGCAEFSGLDENSLRQGAPSLQNERDASLESTGLTFIDSPTERSTPSGRATSDSTCATGDRIPCLDRCGVRQCVNGIWSACGQGIEFCNDHDDDCDGQTDEAFYLGSLCSAQLANRCTALGELVCSTNQVGAVCQTGTATASVEVCDGIDNDCDGISDEGFDNELCCSLNEHCGPTEHCRDGLCVSRTSLNQACSAVTDCPVGSICLNAACQAQCSLDADCPATQRCGCHTTQPDCQQRICVANNRMDSSGSIHRSDPADGQMQTVNNCIDAIEMDTFGVYWGSNADSADELDANCGQSGRGSEQVFSFVARDDAMVFLDTSGSEFDTVLSVRTNCGDIDTELYCDDDGGHGFQSRVEYFARAQTRYFVIVHGFRANLRGAVRLTFGSMQP